METVVAAISDLRTVFPEKKIFDPSSFAHTIDSLCREAGQRWREYVTTPSLTDSLIGIVYDAWHVTFDPDQDNLESLLPHMVLSGKRGSCLGVSLLFLILAEKLDYALYGVLLPGHFFIRYDDGSIYRNVEPNKKGCSHPNEYYRDRYGIDDNSWYTMKNLSRQETEAVFFFNIANICMKEGKYKEAKRYYKGAISGFEGFAEAWGNLALTYVFLKEDDSARIAFNRAYALRPKLERLAENIGAFELGLHRYEDALKAYRNGLRYFPQNPELLYGAAYTFYELGFLDSAVLFLNGLVPQNDTLCREYKLLQLIKEVQARKK